MVTINKMTSTAKVYPDDMKLINFTFFHKINNKRNTKNKGISKNHKIIPRLPLPDICPLGLILIVNKSTRKIRIRLTRKTIANE